jgi:hypothetical protein
MTTTTHDIYTHITDDRAPSPSTFWRKLDGSRPAQEQARRAAPRKAAFLLVLADVRKPSAAYLKAEVPKTTVDNWRKYDRVFARAFDAAKEGKSL